MKNVHAGDTLIEVLFAFVILSVVMSSAFIAAMQSYKFGLAAQNQTQASFLAQYQAEALRSYRDALSWDSNTGVNTFLDGQVSGGSLPVMRDYLRGGEFMMCKKDNNGTPYWAVVQKTEPCVPGNQYNSYAEYLAPQLGDEATMYIKLDTVTGSPSDPSVIKATITVNWQPRNTTQIAKVENVIFLTKQ